MTQTVKSFTLKFEWHNDGRWTLTSDGIKGLVLTTHTFPQMLGTLGTVVPALMRENGQAFPEENAGGWGSHDDR